MAGIVSSSDRYERGPRDVHAGSHADALPDDSGLDRSFRAQNRTPADRVSARRIRCRLDGAGGAGRSLFWPSDWCGTGWSRCLTRVFYAMQDTRTPVAAGIVIIVINIALGFALVDSLGHAGLALALTVSTGIEALILFVVLRRRIGGFDDSFGSGSAAS